MSKHWLKVFFCVTMLVLLLNAAAPTLAQEQTHVVQPGENLYRIALEYGVDINLLAQVNGITNTWQIYSGQTLIIPGANSPAPDTSASVPAAPMPEANVSAPAETASSGTPVYHTVQRGEFLATIARQYGVTPEQIVQFNHLANPNYIYSGEQLIVSMNGTVDTSVTTDTAVAAGPPASAPDASAPAAVPTTTTHVVQAGEHLSQIAQLYGVSWVAIAQTNGLVDPNQIYAGEQLVIPAPATNATSSDMGMIAASAPAATTTDGISITVILSQQMTYVYQNGVLIRSVLVSTGLPGTPTVTGDYTIYSKYESQLMVGPGYYLPDVPWVLYFYEGYSFHGTYWHHNFGFPMSHGCVNMPTPDAQWLYSIAGIGTPVHIQY
jgi:LysM repeat protein